MQAIPQKQRIVSCMAVIGLLFVILYAQTLHAFIQAWSSNEDYGHGFLILPISLYLIWRKRHVLIEIAPRPAAWGSILILIWIVLYFIGNVGRIETISGFSMLFFLLGSLAYLLGSRIMQVHLFPVLFLVFMFPIPSEIYSRLTNPLMLLSSAASFHVLDTLNLPVLRDGNIISLPNYTMEVVTACSGIRSIISILAMAMIMGYLFLSSNIMRGLLGVLAVPIAMIGNIFRIVVTALLVFYVSPQSAEGFSHSLSGVLTFLLALLLLVGCLELIQWFGKKRESLL